MVRIEKESAPESGACAKAASLPPELDLRPSGRGFVMHGWDFTRSEVAEAITHHRMLNPAIELGTNACPWNCSFCFTENPDNTSGQKRRLRDELTLEERLGLIDEAARLGARSINFVGAGEPTIDPHFFTLVEHMRARGITPIIYSEGALHLTDRAFARRLYALGATVVLKVNSLENTAYQNAIVRGQGKSINPRASEYTRLRNEAISVLIEEGFASSEPTRLAFDTIICRQNHREIPEIHRFARRRNIFVLFVNYLPSGRRPDGLHDALSAEEQLGTFAELARIDEREFGIRHAARFPYAGGVPCTIRGLGLFVKITGHAFDCPGELIELGNVQRESLSEIWKRARPITRAFDGGCAPREAAWERSRRRLKLLG